MYNVITGVRYNRVNFCTKMTNFAYKSVRYNRVYVNNRVRYNRVSLHFERAIDYRLTSGIIFASDFNGQMKKAN
jgi:hypothetical protein